MDTIDVTAAIIIKDQKLLIAQRLHKDKLANKWELPGGKKEKNETLQECLKRELKEEFEIDAKIGEHITNSIFEYPHIKINLQAFLVKDYEGNIKLNSHNDVNWVTKNEITHFDFAEADKPILIEILQRGLI